SIGNSRRLQLKRGWTFPSIIWGMIVARKGSIKTWSMVPAVRPLHLVQEEYHRQYDREKTEYDNKRAEFMLLSPKQRRDVTPPEIKAPIRKRILSRDATEARIVKNMAENSRGFCVFCDELTTLLKGFGQYTKDAKGGNGQSIFNSIFNGEGIESERMEESRFSPYACVCILGSIQPGMLKRCFDQEAFESGFASRFLIVSPPLRVAAWSDATVPEEVETAFHTLVFELLRLKMEPIFAEAKVEYDEWNPNGVTHSGEQVGNRPVLVDTTPEALAVYQDFFNRTAEEMRATDDDNIRGAFEKHRAYVARLALVIHVTRVAEQRIMFGSDMSKAPWSTDRIDEFRCDATSMRAAVVIGEWFKYEVLRAYATWGGLADETPTVKVDGFQQRVVEFLEQKHEPVSVSDLKRRFKADKETVPKAVDALLARGLIEPVTPEMSGPGRRSELYRLKK
ncbi:MAG: DUF3987 domain-containing protein, partial [Thermoguttaceae bacterium]